MYYVGFHIINSFKISIDSSLKVRFKMHMKERKNMIKIGDFASIFNVSIKTIRFYEKKGLLKPAYVDIYSGYRYYDESNVQQMSKIIALKELGLELNEIYNLDDDLVQSKIKEYEEKIKKYSSHIHILKTLSKENGGVNNLKTFVHDENAIGKWTLEGVYDKKEDYPKCPCEFDLGIKELYLMPNGKEYWVIAWTKGIIYISGRENKYEIENDKMFLQLVDPIDENEYKIAVYKKVNNYIYSVDDIRVKDNIHVDFVEDRRLIGFWEGIDFISQKDVYIPIEEKNSYDLAIKQITVSPNGKVLVDYGFKIISTTYTKGYIMDLCFKDTLCKYDYRNVKGKDYLIVEWKSGDYIFGKNDKWLLCI